ncbi:MAG TPA: hypothetical protein VH704_13250 [Casimicrobiaceae bacterium]|jgi:hypothetical protein|nr:hypothetical protein [Casimicrobiaceae bacterium]
MRIQPSRSRVGGTLVAVALATLIAVGLLDGVATLFLRDGTPFEQALIAERACSEYRFVSEREACMRAFAARADRPAVASR